MTHFQGNYGEARTYHEQALAIFREVGDRSWEARCLGTLGPLKSDQGDYEAAWSLHEQALAIFREIGDRSWEDWSLLRLGIVAREQGRLAAARAFLAQGLTSFRQFDNPEDMLETLEEWAALTLAEGTARRAARLAGAVQAGREAISIPIPPEQKDMHERTLSTARAALGDDAFAAAWNEGRAMTLYEAADYALANE